MNILRNTIFKKQIPFFSTNYSFTQLQRAQTIPLQPVKYELNIKKIETIPSILRQPDELLVKNWWSTRPFPQENQLYVPIYSFVTGQYTGESVELPQDIFNVPLRRDLIHRTLLWRQNLYYIRTHATRTKGTTAGSGKKPSPQKGQGRARRGNKRAPQHKKGGKAHGPQPRLMRYPLNKKVRLQALYCMLSAKLAEGKLRVIDSEQVDLPKTQLVHKIIENQDNQKSRILLIHSYSPCENFLRAQQNIRRLQTCEPNRINIIKLLKQERIYITKEGLQQLVQDLRDRKFLKYRLKVTERQELVSETQRKLAKGEEEEEELKYKYDPTKPLQFKFQILNDYLSEYEKIRKEGRLDDYKIKY